MAAAAQPEASHTGINTIAVDATYRIVRARARGGHNPVAIRHPPGRTRCTFEFSDAKSHKFWNIDVQGAAYTVTLRQIGTAGQSRSKSFATPAAAQTAADKLIREKTRQGYAETTPKALPPEAEAFQKALVENPDDMAGWCAYADYLAEQGDARGEFMQAQIALEDTKRRKKEREALKEKEKALLDEHEREWLGGLAAFVFEEDAERRGIDPTNTHTDVGTRGGGIVGRRALSMAAGATHSRLTRRARFVRELPRPRHACTARTHPTSRRPA